MHLTCPADCRRSATGRHEIEAMLVCPACDAAPYRLKVHEHRTGQSGRYWYEIEPTPDSGAPKLPEGAAAVCPRCGGGLARR